MKAGDIVKLKNPRKREAKRRWRVVELESVTLPATMTVQPGGIVVNGAVLPTVENPMKLRRLDLLHQVIERYANRSQFVPISFWEKIWRRY